MTKCIKQFLDIASVDIIVVFSSQQPHLLDLLDDVGIVDKHDRQELPYTPKDPP